METAGGTPNWGGCAGGGASPGRGIDGVTVGGCATRGGSPNCGREGTPVDGATVGGTGLKGVNSAAVNPPLPHKKDSPRKRKIYRLANLIFKTFILSLALKIYSKILGTFQLCKKLHPAFYVQF